MFFHPSALGILTMGACSGQPCIETPVRATALLTGATRVYTVLHRDGVINRIVDPDGWQIPRHAEQYSEVAEAFYIDRERACRN